MASPSGLLTVVDPSSLTTTSVIRALDAQTAGLIIGTRNPAHKHNDERSSSYYVECLEFDELRALAATKVSNSRISTLTQHQHEALRLFQAFTAPAAVAVPLPDESSNLPMPPVYYRLPHVPGLEAAVAACAASQCTIYAPPADAAGAALATEKMLAEAAHHVVKQAPGLVDDMGAAAVVQSLRRLGSKETSGLGEQLRGMHADYLLARDTSAAVDSIWNAEPFAVLERRLVVAHGIPQLMAATSAATPQIASGRGHADGFVAADAAIGSGLLLLGVVVGYALKTLLVRRSARNGRNTGPETSYKDRV